MGIPGLYFLSNVGNSKAVAAAAVETTAAAPAAPAAASDAAAPAPGAATAANVDQAIMDLGKASYVTCAACHGVDGQGLKAGPMLMAPSFTGSPLLLDANHEKAIAVVLKGIAKEDAKYLGMMAPLGAALDDEKLAAVLTYLRNSFGNSAPAITADQVKAARAKFDGLSAPAGMTRKQIEEIGAAAPAP